MPILNPVSIAHQEAQDVVEGALLTVYTEYGDEMSTMIRAFSFRDAIQLRYLHDGLRLVSHDNIEMQGNIYFKKNFFNEYRMAAPQVTFTVRTKILCQALKMFKDLSYSVRMVYVNEGDPLELFLECSSMKAKVIIPTMPNDELLDIDSQNEKKLKVLINPVWMSELIQDLDPSADYVKMEFYTDKLKTYTNTDTQRETFYSRADENDESNSDYDQLNGL